MGRRMDELIETQGEFDFAVVSPALTVQALRDSGYKDTDHALAELIDNSIEAEARLVELVVCEAPPDPGRAYARARVSEIAVADDGCGMDAVTLRRALKFGDGTRLDRKSGGIGRFGIGLPNSSISQCRRVDVWSWTNGPENAMHCYLSIDDIEAGARDVPEPVAEPVPERWKTVSEAASSPTGTLVVWSTLDRVRWRSGERTLERTAELCGRLYRKFLTNGNMRVNIMLKMARQTDAGGLDLTESRSCPPNDPLYLMAPSATPPPFDQVPMFREYNSRVWTIRFRDELGAMQSGNVRVQCTLAKPDAINRKKSEVQWPASAPAGRAGNTPWGKHAARNQGVSIVRSGRELELSQAWVNSYEPQERWWTVEVEFDPILDEIFGVVNNKQHAHGFVAGAGFDWEQAALPGETFGQLRERLGESGDPRVHLIDIWMWIDDQIREMRKERSEITKGTGSGGTTRHPQTGESAEDVATTVIVEQTERGERGTTDEAPNATDEEKIAEIAESVEHLKVDSETAQQWAEETVKSGRRVLIRSVRLGHRDAFFDVESVNDVIEIWINDRHPVYSHLIDLLDEDTGELTREDLADRIEKASFTLRMILIAWARYEDKAPSGLKDRFEDFRMDWGREARYFVETIE